MPGQGSLGINESIELQVRRRIVKAILATMVMVALVAGCQNTKKTDDKTALTPSVTDISPAPVASSYAPPPQQAVQPVVYDTQPAPAMTAPAAAAAGGSQYTVKKGDTLWKIAASNYGNGNQWQRIASANPGLSPTSLKVGQTIVIP